MTRSAYDKIAAGLNEALATAPPRLTPAQRKALLWLPADGSWATGAAHRRTAIRALQFFGLTSIDMDYPGSLNSRCVRYRLSLAGIAARRELEKRDVS